jgi:hypothetical protein
MENIINTNNKVGYMLLSHHQNLKETIGTNITNTGF